MFQQIMLIGNLGKDPEMRYTPSGVPVTNFNMAVSKKWTGQDGQSQEKTIWFRVAVWRKQAETANQYLTKGSRVLVIGELEEARIYTAPDGTPRVSLEVTAQSIKFMSTKSESGGYGDTDVLPVDRGYGGGGYTSGGNATNGGKSTASDDASQTDDDIPF